MRLGRREALQSRARDSAARQLHCEVRWRADKCADSISRPRRYLCVLGSSSRHIHDVASEEAIVKPSPTASGLTLASSDAGMISYVTAGRSAGRGATEIRSSRVLQHLDDFFPSSLIGRFRLDRAAPAAVDGSRPRQAGVAVTVRSTSASEQ